MSSIQKDVIMIFRPQILFLFVFLAVWSPAVMGDELTLEPVQDATLFEDEAGTANGSGRYLFMGRVGEDGDDKLRRALVRFDLSGIPTHAIINSVDVHFEITKVPLKDIRVGTATLHRVTSSWGEGASNAPGGEGQGIAAQANDATWQYRFYDGTDWSVPGGDFVSTPSASQPYNAIEEPLDFSSSDDAGLIADVQAWVEMPASNHGWMLLGEESEVLNYTARQLVSREDVGDLGPKLVVDFTVPSVTDNLVLTEVVDSMVAPVSIANANDGSERLFVVEQPGRVRIIDLTTESLLPTPYLDVTALVDTAGSEQGLLGLAFHPDFASNRRLFVYYIRDPGVGSDRSVLAEYEQSEINPNVVSNTPGKVLLEFEQPASNHNGGDLHFGADGYLYIASGDGGGSNDFYNNGQDVDSLKGKILRIDVDSAPPQSGELCGLNADYGIPPGNAYPGNNDGCDEILHTGLRNPWRFSFDALTEELFIGDVGQNDWEEVDYAPAGSPGLNFGWPCFEGTSVFRQDVTCPNAVDPIIEYPSSGSGVLERSITGGYVYRGSSTALYGRYVYGDYWTGRIWVASRENGQWVSEEWVGAAAVQKNITAFGQDEKCELYIADADPNTGAGKIFRIDDSEMLARSGFEKMRCQ